MTTKSKDIIFLLGAGASAEAAIPPSGKMIDKIEELLTLQYLSPPSSPVDLQPYRQEPR